MGRESRPEAGEDFVDRIVEANNRFLSWRNRLGWILGLFEDSSFEPDTGQLIYIAVYLRFIGTGEVPCKEEGGHYRPSHHAKAAQQIYRKLSEITTPENAFIVRKIYPWLPSFDSAFTRAEPLTRIRDLAHRNDIPAELKNEIKHTLQNKLHRSAGPEDLVTSEGLLKRITSPGAAYPSSFVVEFRRFHEELREFFNARSLDERLEALAADANSAWSPLIKKFLEAKKGIDSSDGILALLVLLTGLRIQFRNTGSAADAASSRSQELQMADIGLEDFSFVLLSRLNNYFEDAGEEMPWKQALFSLEQAIVNLGLSGFDTGECGAIESELKNWSPGFNPLDAEELIRLRATLDRCSRLAADYCNKILSLFPEKAGRLGLALGVDLNAVKVFSEAEIRSHPVFQVSKLAALLLRRIRTIANIYLWDIIVPGDVCGRIVAVHDIGDLPDRTGEPIIALLEKAEGDEEMPVNVAGIIVAREIPHLSHLAVRARQKGVVFVTDESREGFDGLADLINQIVVLEASAGRVRLNIVPDCEERRKETGGRGIVNAAGSCEVILPAGDGLIPLLPLSKAVAGTSGGKAAASGQLEILSGLEGSGFRTAPGLVIPFGVMEACLSDEPALEEEYRKLVSGLGKLNKNESPGVFTRLREIISLLNVRDEIVSGITGQFRTDADRLMVRSSSNCEDMRNLAGAGLYDSVANVLPRDAAAAIRIVWASLWTKRAVMSRENCGISHERAFMAVLIQKMIVPELSFILHTRNPVDDNPGEVYMELAVGMGETLASASTPGFPCRMVYNKKTGDVRTLAFASFSSAAWPGPPGILVSKTVDYSGVRLSKERGYRNLTGKRLGVIGQFVEDAFKHPQDIEGVISGDEIFLVQSRDQHIPSGPGSFPKKN